MQYQAFQDLKISALSLTENGLPLVGSRQGEKDFPVTDERPAPGALLALGKLSAAIDSGKADALDKETLYKLAMQNGINLFDICRGYKQSNPEPEAGRILSKYPRESFYLSAGFPGYVEADFDKPEVIFEEQLKNLQTGYLDFYQLQNICDFNIDWYLDHAACILEFLSAEKAAGRIRHAGCSFVGSAVSMKSFLERYGDSMEFCRFSFNWMDWDLHHAKQKVKICREKNLPVWADEPLKKGVLEKPDEEYKAALNGLRAGEDVPALGFRYLQSFPEVKTSLCAINEPSQLLAGIRALETIAPLEEQEKQTLYDLAKKMLPKKVLDCTGCRICMQHCIKHLDIAGFMDIFNEEIVSGYNLVTPMYVDSYPAEKKPFSCCHWGPCQSMCPQHLDIIRMMLRLGTRVRRNPLV